MGNDIQLDVFGPKKTTCLWRQTYNRAQGAYDEGSLLEYLSGRLGSTGYEHVILKASNNDVRCCDGVQRSVNVV